jgi:hypothetical protein
MLLFGISRFVGSWISASGYNLRIKEVRKDLATVDFLNPNGAAIQRPYMGGALSTNMVAYYDDYYGEFEVELWEKRKFILHLSHEYDYELDPERREALVPAVSWNTRGPSMDKWRSSFGPLDHFVREKEQAAFNGRIQTTTPEKER